VTELCDSDLKKNI